MSDVVRLDDLTPAQRRLVLALIDAVREVPKNDTPTPDRLLSIDEAAVLLGLGRTTAYGEIAAGRLRSMKVGRRRLIPRSAITAYVVNGGSG